MQVDIYIRERNGNREIRIPWLPDVINVAEGEVTTAEYKIIDKGDVAIPTGTGLASYSWESVWPGANRTDQSLQRGTWQDPKTYHATMKDWMQKGTSLNIIVTGYPINANVFVKTYKTTAGGGFGDLQYSVEFQEEREIKITSVTASSSSSGTGSSGSSSGSSSGGSNSGTSRPSSTDQTTRYTIKKGDTLWSISQRMYGDKNKWGTIYSANKDIIESTAKKRGYKSSNNGRRIFPGITIAIPR